MTAEVREGPHLIDPFELLEGHGITTSLVAPRHDCRCGASFVIDPSADDLYAASGGHIREVMIAAAHAATAFLAVAQNKGSVIPDEIREMLAEIAADSGV